MLLHASAGVLSKEYWERSCALPNLEQVTLTKGYGAIADNVVFGYQWAAGELSQESSHPKHGYKYELPTPIARAADYVMNVDSDMLVTADFFVRMAAGYERARELCVYPLASRMSYMSLVFFKKYHVSLFSTPPCTSFAARTLSPQHTSLPLHTHTRTTVAIASGSRPTSSLSRHLALY